MEKKEGIIPVEIDIILKAFHKSLSKDSTIFKDLSEYTGGKKTKEQAIEILTNACKH